MRVEGAPTLTGHAPCLMGTLCASRTPFSCTLRILVDKNSLYILPKVLTTVSHKYPLFSFRAVSVSDLEHHVVSKRSQGQVFERVINPYLVEVLHIRDLGGPRHTGSMETKLEAMEVQAPAVKEEDIP